MNRFLNIVFPCALALFCSACVSSFDRREDVIPADRARVQFFVEAPATKAALGAGAESLIRTLDLFVFHSSNGGLESTAHSDVSSSVSVNLPTEESLDWFLIANLPAFRMDGVATLDDLLSRVTYLSDTDGAMVMSVSGTTLIPASSRGEEVNLGPYAVERYACKISVEDITVDWLGDFATVPSCMVDRLIVMNARLCEPLSGVPSALDDAYWLNKLTDEAADSDPSSREGRLAYDSPSLSVISAAKTALGSVLYAMPNPSVSDENALDTPWAPRRTRLCIRLTVDGVSQWYPVDLPAMERNHHYVVEDLVIKGPGTPGPDQGIDRTAIAFRVSVTPWVEESGNIIVVPEE